MIKHGFGSFSLRYSVREFKSVLTARNISADIASAGPVTSQQSLAPKLEHLLPRDRCGDGHCATVGALETASLIARSAVLGRLSVMISDIDVIGRALLKGLQPK